ncbi:MAG TPA: hypothetical protein VF181_01375 [Balneolaceae bacterium]
MKKVSFLSTIIFFVFLSIGMNSASFAQLKADLRDPSVLRGPILKQDRSEGANLGNLFNMTMDHSYAMTFSSFGGQMHNINAYTNTMRFYFSEDLTGRVDLSILHSPFGNSFMSKNDGMNAKFIIRNAELNYQINDRSNISIHFRQIPGYGMNSWRTGYYRSPFYSPFSHQNF